MAWKIGRSWERGEEEEQAGKCPSGRTRRADKGRKAVKPVKASAQFAIPLVLGRLTMQNMDSLG